MISIDESGIKGAIAYLVTQGAAAERASLLSLSETADRAADYARAYVPIDKANLQDAIVVIGEDGGDSYTVMIDMAHGGTRAETVEQYASKMEYGDYSAKMGWPRGPGFMARAAEAARRDLESSIASGAIARAMSIAGSFVSGAASMVGGFFRSITGMFR